MVLSQIHDLLEVVVWDGGKGCPFWEVAIGSNALGEMNAIEGHFKRAQNSAGTVEGLSMLDRLISSNILMLPSHFT